MEQVLNLSSNYTNSVINVLMPVLVAIGLIIGVASIVLIGFKFMAGNNEEARVVGKINLKWAIIGLICICLITPIMGYILYNFF
ncbi:hypothetical protein [Clostridium thermobutyricum]|uniref:hypothetical protein n=1 Tax=Clostridium thermobutyricum TaxID=29372 RepID=UPI0018A9F06F